MDMNSYASALGKRGFVVHMADSKASARDTVLELIGSGSVGIGGSATVRELGLYEALTGRGNAVFCHSYAKPEERASITEKAFRADFYLCSSNAITADGRLVNIDGTGNRVSSMFAGPKRVIIVAGRNKFCGDLDDAVARIKREACPPNARRLGLSTPCAVTGVCNNCSSPQRMCRVTTIMEYPPRMVQEIHVVLVDESLGF